MSRSPRLFLALAFVLVVALYPLRCVGTSETKERGLFLVYVRRLSVFCSTIRAC